MTTLYDLLTALPDDDADELRAAFVRSAKEHHPDRNPGDPDAPHRFRRIVRANAILSDQRQRTHYDVLLKTAERQQAANPGRSGSSARARKYVRIVASSLVYGIVVIVCTIQFAHLIEALRDRFPEVAL